MVIMMISNPNYLLMDIVFICIVAAVQYSHLQLLIVCMCRTLHSTNFLIITLLTYQV